MKVSHVTRNTLGTLAVAGIAASMALVPAAAKAADFSGKSISVIVPFKEGGGADVYARIFAPFITRHLPGKPNILIRNMPGGGSIKGANYFEKSAEKDGTTVICVSNSTMLGQLFGGTKRKYDMTKWRPINVSAIGTVFYAVPGIGADGKDIIADVKALQKREMTFGAKSPISGELRGFLAFELLGLNVKGVFGMSRGGSRKAMMRKEFHVGYDNTAAYEQKVEKLVKKGQMVPLFTLGYPKADGTIARDPEQPDMPHMTEIYQKLNGGKMPSGHQWQALHNFMNLAVLSSKGFSLPKGTPDDVYETYVKTMQAVIADKEFMKKSSKLLGKYPQTFGKDAEQVYDRALNWKPETMNWMKGWVKKKFDVTM
jgi:tripartite-type tricarboxylate transporter receptor subunit TctC